MAQVGRLRGFVGQNLSGRKRLLTGYAAFKDSALGDTSLTAQTDLWAFVYATGPGGSGGSFPVSPGAGGSGGASGFKRLRLLKGQTISWVLGVPGAGQATNNAPGQDATDTVVTVPGAALLAGGGKGGLTIATPGGACSGPWTIARNGGATTPGADGSSPIGGGVGGTHSGIAGGGGGAAGFLDLVDGGLFAGNGGIASGGAGSAPGGGSSGALGSGASSAAGSAGRVIVFAFNVAL